MLFKRFHILNGVFNQTGDTNAAGAASTGAAAASVATDKGGKTEVKTVTFSQAALATGKYILLGVAAIAGTGALCFVGGYSARKGVNRADTRNDPLHTRIMNGGDEAMSTSEAGRRGGAAGGGAGGRQRAA